MNQKVGIVAILALLIYCVFFALSHRADVAPTAAPQLPTDDVGNTSGGITHVQSTSTRNPMPTEAERDHDSSDEATATASDLATARITAPQGVLTAYVVTDAEDRRIGLSRFSELPREYGMLFVYDESALHGIWMRNMKFAIDIVFLDEKREVVTVHEHIKPETHPEIFRPQTPARYVLELNAGMAATLGITQGVSLDVTRGDILQ